MKILRWIRKWFWCSWKHERCYPEVWGRGSEGPWHCLICHPCGEGFDLILKGINPRKQKNWITTLLKTKKINSEEKS